MGFGSCVHFLLRLTAKASVPVAASRTERVNLWRGTRWLLLRRWLLLGLGGRLGGSLHLHRLDRGLWLLLLRRLGRSLLLLRRLTLVLVSEALLRRATERILLGRLLGSAPLLLLLLLRRLLLLRGCPPLLRRLLRLAGPPLLLRRSLLWLLGGLLLRSLLLCLLRLLSTEALVRLEVAPHVGSLRRSLLLLLLGGRLLGRALLLLIVAPPLVESLLLIRCAAERIGLCLTLWLRLEVAPHIRSSLSGSLWLGRPILRRCRAKPAKRIRLLSRLVEATKGVCLLLLGRLSKRFVARLARCWPAERIEATTPGRLRLLGRRSESERIP